MVKPKLTCLLNSHHLDVLERGFNVMKRSHMNRWIERHYWYNVFEEKIYWNTRKIWNKDRNFFYPFQIREMLKKNEMELDIELSIYLQKNKYEHIEFIYKKIEWKFETEGERDEIFTCIQEIRNQYSQDFSLFPKIK